MAANSTLLAIQCSSGVAVAAPPRCGLQLRRNLVTKTPKTTIMAANNPALQYDEAGVLVFAPCQLHRNAAASTKRNKTIVVAAAYPTQTDRNVDAAAGSGTPLYTVGKLQNSSGGTIFLSDKEIWQGSQTGDFPNTIDDQEVGEFRHSAVDGAKIPGSVGGLAYKLADGSKWIVAWSNPQDDPNKVYTDILQLQETVDWKQIKTNLDKYGRSVYKTTHFGYYSEIEIDLETSKPTMKAKIEPWVNEDKEK